MPQDISTPTGKLQRIILAFGAVWTAMCMAVFQLSSYISGGGAQTAVLALCDIISGIIMFIFWREGSIRRYVSEFIFVLMTLVYWSALVHEDPTAIENGVAMLIWAFLVILCMLWNILQTVHKSQKIRKHSANIDHNNQLKQLLDKQISEVQEKIVILDMQRQDLLTKL